MDDMSFVQWLIAQTGLTGIAALSLWIMKTMNEQAVIRRAEDMNREIKRHEEAVKREQENSETHRDDKRLLLDVVRANTESNARLTTIISNLDRHIYPGPNGESRSR
jgi:hypothetical protein